MIALPPTDTERIDAAMLFVCKAFGVTYADLVCRRRAQELADPRSAFYHVTHGVMHFGTCRIARWLGGRDHSSVVYGARRGDALYQTDPLFRSRVEWVVEQLKQRGIV